jgi:putative restriction endonuclease
MRGYIGVTDGDWAGFLAALGVTEVNFWLPSPDIGFRALRYGEPFLFKTHYPDNRIVGGGFFEHFTVLRASEAWEFMGEGNGCPSLDSMVERVRKYRRAGVEKDPQVGCVILNDVYFFDAAASPPAPASMARNIVRGKIYELPGTDSEAEAAFRLLLAGVGSSTQLSGHILGPPRGLPVKVIPRLGQGGFRAVVLDVYQGRCAITGHRIRPTLQAAHIKPVSEGGEHRVDNGLLLRSDVHTMFDRGYLTVDDRMRLRVSPRLRGEFGNGDEFYAREGESIWLPQRRHEQPSQDFLQWHQDTVFQAS